MTHHITQSQASQEVRRQESRARRFMDALALWVTVLMVFFLAAFAISLILQGVRAI